MPGNNPSSSSYLYNMEKIVASIITIGDELLIGQVVDTNSAWMGQELNKNGIWVGHTNTIKTTPAGKDTVQTATVRVPSSYFTAIYKLQDPKTSPPLPDFVATQLASIRDGVKKVVGLKTDDALSVDTYADIPPELAMATGPSVQASTLNTVGGHAKEIGVAVLAVVSLLMMATMVRKSAPAQLVLPSVGGGPPAPVAGTGTLGSGESVAGEVGTGPAALDGMEMDEDAVRTQQMLDQVSTMVKKWLSRA